MMSQLRPLLWNTTEASVLLYLFSFLCFLSSACLLFQLSKTALNQQKQIDKKAIKISWKLHAQFMYNMYIVQYLLASKINPHFLPKGLSTYIHYRASKARNWTLPTNKEGPFLMLQCYKIIKKCNFRKSHWFPQS